jgi:hypothetical protein
VAGFILPGLSHINDGNGVPLLETPAQIFRGNLCHKHEIGLHAMFAASRQIVPALA